MFESELRGDSYGRSEGDENGQSGVSSDTFHDLHAHSKPLCDWQRRV